MTFALCVVTSLPLSHFMTLYLLFDKQATQLAYLICTAHATDKMGEEKVSSSVSVLILWVPQLNNIRALVNIQILPCLGHYQGDWA